MAYCETKTGTINKELFELAAIIRARPDLEKMVNEQSSRDIVGQDMLGRFPGISITAGEISARPRAPRS